MDPIGVCNAALVSELGDVFIQSFEEGTSRARLCAATYPESRDAVLEMAPWNFAQAFATLAHGPENTHAASTQMGWRYTYTLPPDEWCIKVHGTDEGNGARFDPVGRCIYSNEGSVTIRYTRRVEDLGSWSPLALQVLIKLIASKLAKPITGQNSTAELKLQEAMAFLQEARFSDGREGPPPVLRPNMRLLHARHRFGVLGGTVQ